MRNGKMFISPTLPLIYLASLNKLGLSYSGGSVIICFLNTISTIVGIFFLSHFFLTKIDLSVVLIFLFISGNSFFHFFNQNENDQLYNDFDLIHNYGKEIKAPIFSPILNFLSFSKHSSFAIPLALFTLAFAHPSTVKKRTTYILSGIFLSLNPSLSVSLSLAISLIFYSNSIKYIFPFFISLIPKLIIFIDSYNLNENFLKLEDDHAIYFNGNSSSNQVISFLLNYKPLWREYQLQGIFYSPFWAYLDSFGILFFFLIISPFALYMIGLPVLTQRFIASFSSFVFLSLIRIGNDYFENSLAITSVFLPYLIFICVNSFDKIEYSIIGKYDNNQIIYKSNFDEKKMNSLLKLALNFFSNSRNGKSNQIKGFLKALRYLIILIFVSGTFFSAYYVTGFTIDQLNPFNFCPKYVQSSKNGDFHTKKGTFIFEPEDFLFEENLTDSVRLFRIDYDDYAFSEYLKESSINPRDPIFCNLRLFNTISTFAGRPIFSADFSELWKRGADISEELSIVKLINKTNDKFTVMKKLGFNYLFELMENPFVVVNSSIINAFNVLYTDQKYIFLKAREDS